MENEQSKKLERIDPWCLKDGYKVDDGFIFSQNNHPIGPVIYKSYDSEEEYRADVKLAEENEKKDKTPLQRLVQGPEFVDIEEGFDSDTGVPHPERWSEIAKKIFPDNQWRMKNLIPFQGFVILASIAGEGKTWLAMYMAQCISEGINFLDTFETVQGRVLYVNAEMSISEIQRRGKKLAFKDTENLTILSRDNFNIFSPSSIDTTLDLKWLLKYIHKNKIDVVVVDTFRAVAGGMKEQNAEEVRSLFKKLHVLKNSGVCVIFLDHHRKPQNFEGKIPKKEHLFGSTDKAGSIEVLLMLRNEDNKEIHVYQRKNRIGRETEPFKVSMTDYTENDKTFIKFGYEGPLEDKDTKKEEAKGLILEILVEGPKTRKEMLTILRIHKIGDKNASSALRELEKEKSIDSTKQGKENLYSLSDIEKGLKDSEESIVEDEQKAIFDNI